ncbi:MAG: universal stress protein [Candidatus Binatia bacterium]
MVEKSNMSSLKKILVASDLSSRAEKALARATQIAREHEATLTILHVMEDGARDEMQAAATNENALRQILAGLSPQCSEPVTVRVVIGKPFVEIIRHAREEAADLIIVGAHGAHFIKDVFFGTTAQKIVRKGDRPVLVVKQTPQGSYRRVLVTVDFSEDSRLALELALQLAPRAEVHILHVYHGFEDQLRRGGATASELMRSRRQWVQSARQELETFLREVNCRDRSVSRILKYGRAPDVIVKTAKRLRADLIAVGTTGRSGLPYILLGSVAEHVLREVKSDVLVTRSGPVHFELP